MVFGTWYCAICEKTLNVGTVAPRSAMLRHLASARHLKFTIEKAERDANAATKPDATEGAQP